MPKNRDANPTRSQALPRNLAAISLREVSPLLGALVRKKNFLSRSETTTLAALALVLSLLSQTTSLASSSSAEQDGPPVTGVVVIRDVQVGFDGQYKLGFWTPISITLEAQEPVHGHLEVTVPDADGVPTTVASDRGQPIEVPVGGTVSEMLYVKPGQADSGVVVRFMREQEVLAERAFYPGDADDGSSIRPALPATARLFAVAGADVGLADALRVGALDPAFATHVALLRDGSQFPGEALGWDGVDAVILVTSDADLYLDDEFVSRRPALSRWLELGGRMFLFVGQNADDLIAANAPLAPFVPGQYTGETASPQPVDIETLTDSRFPLRVGSAAFRLPVPLLSQLQGRVVATGRGGNLPLIVRDLRGFGELTWVGLDIDRAPLADWAGKPELLRELIGIVGEAESDVASDAGKLTSLGYVDLVGQLRAALDVFPGVRTISFAWVIGLTLLYLTLLGPVDFFLVHRWGRRPVLTWLTLPLFVALISGGAYGLAQASKGHRLRLNQVELVDVDTTRGLLRGNLWAHLYTPRHDRFTLTLQPHVPAAHGPVSAIDATFSWLGLPGSGLGGLESTADSSSIERGYRYQLDRTQLAGVPLAIWSSKSLHGRWAADADFPIQAALSATGSVDEEVLSGTLTNGLEYPLADARLFYRGRMYPLGLVKPGQAVDLERTPPHRSAANHLRRQTTLGKSAPPYDPSLRDMSRTLQMMMWYELAGGASYVGLLNRYQSELDFGHVLDSNRAVLVAKCAHPGSQILRGGDPLADEGGLRLLVYRVILAVEPQENQPSVQ
jgi:hypothetical protein